MCDEDDNDAPLKLEFKSIYADESKRSAILALLAQHWPVDAESIRMDLSERSGDDLELPLGFVDSDAIAHFGLEIACQADVDRLLPNCSGARVGIVTYVVVDKLHRGRGYGAQTVAAIDSMAKRYRLSHVALQCMPGIQPLYARFGWSAHRGNNDNEPLIWMIKAYQSSVESH
jgi:GNAT superfamily N-acetyltransferase